MSDRTSKTILELDKELQERRKKAGLEVTPFNYDTYADKDLAVARSQEASQEKIQENNKTLVQHAIEANAPQQQASNNPQKDATQKEEQKATNTIETATINTSGIPEKTPKVITSDDKEIGD